MKKILNITATALIAVMSISSCMRGNIYIEDLTEKASGVTVTCTPSSLRLKTGESADIAAEVSGAGKGVSVTCLSSDSDVAEAFEVDARTVRVKGVSAGKVTVSVTCGDSAAAKVDVTVTD